MDRTADLFVATNGATRLAVAPASQMLLSTDPRDQQIHFHRVDWKKPSLEVVDAFPPTDMLMGAPTPGRPLAIAVHPSQPLALAISRPRDARAKGEVLFLDLREKSPGRLLRSQLAGYRTEHIVLSPDGQWALVANGGGGKSATPGSIGVLDLRDLEGWEDDRLKEVPYVELQGLSELLGVSPRKLNPTFVAVDPRGEWAAAALRGNDALVWIDLRSASPALAGVTPLPGGSKPTGVALLNRPDGSLLAAIAEEGEQRVSVYRVNAANAADPAALLARLDIRPLIDSKRAGKRRDPQHVVLREVDGRPVAWIGSERSDRVLMFDLSDPTHPERIARVAAEGAPTDLIAVATKRGLLIVSGNGEGSITVFRVNRVP